MERHGTFEITCPCCGSQLTLDAKLGKIIHTASNPHAQTHERDLDHASQLLKQDAARRDALFRQSMADQESKSELLERKFEEALKKGGNEPPARPVREIDLD